MKPDFDGPRELELKEAVAKFFNGRRLDTFNGKIQIKLWWWWRETK